MNTDQQPTIGLSLSGGGFRATLFGLGTLWRLNEGGLLRRLTRISSVSGGSIVAGVLAHRWRQLNFVDDQASNFEEVVAQPVREFCNQTIDVSTALRGHLTPFRSSGEILARRYAKDLFGETLLRQIATPAENHAPRFIFYATNMQTGRSFLFRQDYIADCVLGISYKTEVPLAAAIAASSAVPPIFSPVVLKTETGAWEEPQGKLANLNQLRQRIVLADGRISDNMGVEALLDKLDFVLVSDAGAPFEIDESPFEDDLLQLGRVRDILIEQTRALRRRSLIGDFESGVRRGAYWGIGSAIDAYDDHDALASDNAVTAALQNIPTRLKAFTAKEQGQLINWGYALTDTALRTRTELALDAPQGWPVGAWPLH
ncbi:patatin-like phospholipase family protein [Candidatus Accumulibacter phosphatis]|uniref:Patatin-like phospholipase family protein n=1 Tax=Candidatus Accumulibacter phosphatis TaxID=327160 RepID=A0ABX1U1K4_9PROT|nr:patatin-like phospholipase family protein [Candidatus Accumulibacter phosphatis]NMQ29363.1 patatin-like phospholipase family protein [Candidatus Accumulibacter phosphatis]